jgi:hypothetical protein
MKHLKTLGVAAFSAAALIAICGIGTASATVICKTTTNPCSNDYPKQTVVHAVLKSNTVSNFASAGGTIADKCKKSTIQGETENTGGKGVNVKLPLGPGTFNFEECETTTSVLKKGTLEFVYKGAGSGTVEGFGMEVTIESTMGASCVYGTAATTVLGTVKEPASETADTLMEVNASLPRISGSGFFCPTPITWTAEYTITNPVPFYLAGE